MQSPQIVTLLVVRCAYFSVDTCVCVRAKTYKVVDQLFNSHDIRAMLVVLVDNSIVEFTVKLVYQRIRCRERFLHSIFSLSLTITVRVLLMQERRTIL